MNVCGRINGLTVRVDIPEKFAILYKDSKSISFFLFFTLSLLCKGMRMMVVPNKSVRSIIHDIHSPDHKLIILNNADSYLNSKILKACEEATANVWIMLDKPTYQDIRGIARYRVSLANSILSTRRVG